MPSAKLLSRRWIVEVQGTEYEVEIVGHRDHDYDMAYGLAGLQKTVLAGCKRSMLEILTEIHHRESLRSAVTAAGEGSSFLMRTEMRPIEEMRKLYPRKMYGSHLDGPESGG